MKIPHKLTQKFTKIDIAIVSLTLGFLFVTFLHGDIILTGWSASFHFKGDVLSFYENAKTYVFATSPYPPTIYLIFAAFLAPLDYFGFFNPYHPKIEDLLFLGFWLKILTTVVYTFSAWMFFIIAKHYVDKEKAVFMALLYLLFPLSIFVQFVFSQHDIFYVALTLCGFLFFLKRKNYYASFLFSLAMTFKYFPIFVFVPLLLYAEKNIIRILVHLCICLAPLFLINIAYTDSPAYMDMVRNFSALSRVFDAKIGISVGLSLLVASFFMLCTYCFFKEFSETYFKYDFIVIYLMSAVLPFLYILFHPQWVLFTVPPIVLSYLVIKNTNRLILLDLIGMFFFVISSSIIFPNNVDGAMLRLELFGWYNSNSFTTANLFNIFKENSSVAFYSAFWAYLVIRTALPILNPKSSPPALLGDCQSFTNTDIQVDYMNLRIIYYVGILIFLIPTGISIYKSSSTEAVSISENNFIHGELIQGRIFEQIFIPKSNGEIRSIKILLATFNRTNNSKLYIQLLDATGNALATTSASVESIDDNKWFTVNFDKSIYTRRNEIYKLRLSSPDATAGNAITWWAFKNNIRTDSTSVVDGDIVDNAQFCLKLLKNRE